LTYKLRGPELLLPRRASAAWSPRTSPPR